MDPALLEETLASEQFARYQSHFGFLETHLQTLQIEPLTANWNICMSKFIDMVRYLKVEDALGVQVLEKLNDSLAIILQKSYFNAIIQPNQFMLALTNWLKLLQSQRVTTALSAGFIQTALMLLNDLIQYQQGLDTATLEQSCELIFEYLERVPELLAKGQLLLTLAKGYADLQNHRLSAIYSAYACYCLKTTSNAELLAQASRQLAYQEVNYLSGLFAKPKLQAQLTSLATTAPQDAAFYYCDQADAVADFLLDNNCLAPAIDIYQCLIDTLQDLLERHQFAECHHLEVKSRIKTYLKALGDSQLALANAHQVKLQPDKLLQHWQRRREELAESREAISSQLTNLPIAESLQRWNKYTLSKLLCRLCAETERTLGKPPCLSYTVLKMGSLARQEACLYSDFEFALIWDEPYPGVTQASLKAYFEAFTRLLELKLISLGETHLFYHQQDCSLGMPGGLRFDEGGHYPFNPKFDSRVVLAGTIAEVLKTVEPVADFWKARELLDASLAINCKEAIPVYGLIDAQCLYSSEPLISSDEPSMLFKQWVRACQTLCARKTPVKANYTYAQLLAYHLLTPSMLEFSEARAGSEISKIIDIKEGLLRLPQMLVIALGYFYAADEQAQLPNISCFTRLAQLEAKGLPLAIAQLLRSVLSIAFYWRMRVHAKNNSEEDKVNSAGDDFFTLPRQELLGYLQNTIYPFLNSYYQKWHDALTTQASMPAITHYFVNPAAADKNAVELGLRLNQLLEDNECKQHQARIKTYLLSVWADQLSSVSGISRLWLEASSAWLSQQHELTPSVYAVLQAFTQQVLSTLWSHPDASDPFTEAFLTKLQVCYDNTEQQQLIQEIITLILQLDESNELIIALYTELFYRDENRAQSSSLAYGYYQVLQTLLSQTDGSQVRRLTSAMTDITAIADKTGFRLQEQLAYEHLATSIRSLAQSSPTVASTAHSPIHVKVTRPQGECFNLAPDVMQKIIDTRTLHLRHLVAEPKAKTAYEHRQVAIIEHQTGEQSYCLHFKEHPDFPMMAYASDLLNQRLCGHGSVPNELVIFEVMQTLADGCTRLLCWYPVLISLTAPGKTLKKHLEADDYHSLPRNLKRLSEIFILEAVKHQGDGFARNYVVTPFASNDFGLVCVDSEQMFVTSFEHNSRRLRELSMVYCLPEFQAGGPLAESLEHQALASFAQLDIDCILTAWLDALEQREAAYKALLSAERAQQLLNRHQEHPFILPMVLAEGLVGRLALELRWIQRKAQQAIEQGSLLSPQAILAACSGQRVAALYFNPNVMPPIDRLMRITHRQITASSGEYIHHYLGNKRALAELQSSDSLIAAARAEIHSCRYEQTDILADTAAEKTAEQQSKYFMVFDFQGMPAERQQKQLQYLIQSKDKFSRLEIKNSSELTDDVLINLLKASERSLKRLALRNNPRLTEETLFYLADKCNQLEVLVLSQLGLRDLRRGVFKRIVNFNCPRLRALILNRCENLEHLEIQADVKYFEAKAHKKLMDVKLVMSNLSRAILDENAALSLIDLKNYDKFKYQVFFSLIGVPSSCQKRWPANAVLMDDIFYNTKGDDLYQKGYYSEALEAYRQAIGINSNNAVYYNNKGNTLYQLKRYEEAVVAYEEAIKLNPHSADYYYNKGDALRELKLYNEALAAYETAVKLIPNNASYYNDKVNVLLELKRIDEVIAVYKVAVKKNALYKLKRYDKALVAYEKAIKQPPNSAAYYSNKGNALNWLRQYEEALTAFEDAIKLNPDKADYYNLKGNVLYDLKRYEEALQAANKALELAPTDINYVVSQGAILYRLKYYPAALSALNQALNPNPNLARALAWKGAVLNKLKCYQEALDYLNQALAIDANEYVALKFRGKVYHQLNQFDQALADFDASLCLEPEHEETLKFRTKTLSAKTAAEALAPAEMITGALTSETQTAVENPQQLEPLELIPSQRENSPNRRVEFFAPAAASSSVDTALTDHNENPNLSL